jgi:hypothetical protein
MDLNSGANQHAAGIDDTLTIQYSDTGFTPAQAGFSLQVAGSQSGGGMLTFAAFDGVGVFDQAKQIGTTLTTAVSPFALSSSGGGPSTNPYSLTEIATITFGANAGNATFDAQLTPVPEPAGVALFGGILLFIVNAVRRKVSRAN